MCVIIFCISCFCQLLREEVQGVPATVRPPEGVPGPHEPAMTLLVGGGRAGTDSDVIVMTNPHTGNKDSSLNRAAFSEIIKGPVFFKKCSQ